MKFTFVCCVVAIIIATMTLTFSVIYYPPALIPIISFDLFLIIQAIRILYRNQTS